MKPHEIGFCTSMNDILHEFKVRDIGDKLEELAREIGYLRKRLHAAQRVVAAARGWCETPGHQDTVEAGLCAAVQDYDRQFPWEDA